MSQNLATAAGRWLDGALPANVRVGAETVLEGEGMFRRFRTQRADGLTIGTHCTFNGVHFAVGEEGRVRIGDYCYFTNAILLCDLEIEIGSYVMIAWNATIADSDFHPIEPAARLRDTIACSPLANGMARPPIASKRVVIEDDVWIGQNATILKGVTVGRGSWIEPGALVTKSIPPRSRVLGNPAQIIETL